MFLQNYYNAYGGQQFPSYYTTPASRSPGVYLSYYPFYGQYGQSSSPSHYPKMIQQSQQYHTLGMLSRPSSASASPSIHDTGPVTHNGGLISLSIDEHGNL